MGDSFLCFRNKLKESNLKKVTLLVKHFRKMLRLRGTESDQRNLKLLVRLV